MTIERWSPRRAATVLGAAAFVTYLNALTNGFALDDVPIIVQNPRVHHLTWLHGLLLAPYWPLYGRGLGLYRPLSIFGYAVQWALGGGAAPMFHVVNVLMHVGVVILLFFLLRRLAGQTPAFLGALVFAVHPLHVEVVANVIGQAELGAALGVMGAGLVLSSRPAGMAVGRGRVLAMAALYALALGYKEGAIVAPALLVALDLAQGRVALTRQGIRGWIRALWPTWASLLAVGLGYLALRHHVLGSLAGSDVAPGMPFLSTHHTLMGLRAWPEYMRLLFFPLDLAADYSPGVILPLTSLSPMATLGLLLFIGVVVLAFLTPIRPGAGLPAAWFIITISVTSNLLFPVGIVVAERTLYLPSAALALLVAYATRVALVAELPRLRARVLAGLAAAAVLLLAVRTVLRNPTWHDNDALAAALLQDVPQSYRAQWAAGTIALDRGDTLKADRYFRLAYRIWPEDAAFINDYGNFALLTRRYAMAEQLFRRGILLHPSFVSLHENLARVYIKTDRYALGLAEADTALRYYRNATLLDLRARALFGVGDYAEAARTWQRSFKVGRGSWDSWIGYARARALTRQTDLALAALDTARLRARKDTAALRAVQQARALTLQQAGRTEPEAGAPRRLQDVLRLPDATGARR